VSSILTGVTHEGGTGVTASVEGFEVAGKTGTAQKADLANGGYAARKRVASFVGFVPADDPRLVLSVLVDEPEVNVYGGVVAAPAFRNIARGALHHLSVAPQKPELLPVSLAQTELPIRRAMRKNGALHNGGSGAVADFVGLSLREAVEKARELKMKVKIHGNGYVTRQLPAPGADWSDDDVLVLNLQG
jgi:cell division protein FtsI (penicillin-binding protein 3)